MEKKKKLKNIIIILLIIVILILLLIICNFIYKEKQEETLENRKYYSTIDTNFYLQNGKLYVIDDGNSIQIPGDFSQMNASDYDEENHNSSGMVYFYYNLDNKTYLVKASNTSYTEWTIQELTSESIGMESGSKIKYIRISGNYGYIFYINPDGVGKILKSTSGGEYWIEVETDFTLNEECTLKFLNKYGLTTDGFLTVPSEDGEKCDLYRIDNFSEETFFKIDVSQICDNESLDYYNMPTYYDDSTMVISMIVRENERDTNTNVFLSTSDGQTWMTETEYKSKLKEEEESNDERIARYNEMVENLDDTVYLIDAENYTVDSNEVKISEEKAKEIAEIGFTESASRIASEGIDDTENEYIEIKEVNPNKYFTRKYSEGDYIYTDITRKAYVVTKENIMGCGVMVYVDVTTGLIIGGGAFGD